MTHCFNFKMRASFIKKLGVFNSLFQEKSTMRVFNRTRKQDYMCCPV